MEEAAAKSVEECSKHLSTIQSSLNASIKVVEPLLQKTREKDESLDMSAGLSLLLVRPQVLLSSLQNLVLLLSLQLSGASDNGNLLESNSTTVRSFGDLNRIRPDLNDVDTLSSELIGELATSQEIMDKVRGMETKLEYQIKKLTALVDAEQAKGAEVIEDAEEDPLSFRPNISAMAESGPSKTSKSRGNDVGDRDDGDGIYRPPRIAAMPYNDPATKSTRKDRRAPALLSEFASTIEGAPGLETSSGLSTIPLRGINNHTNSASAKRAAELKRISEFEEENMTRLVTSKREGKRRREDEAALALGYGVGGTGRNRGNRQNGLEAELEGVLGDRRSKGIWESVGSKMGTRDNIFERGKKGATEGPPPRKQKKARFEKDMQGKRK